MKLLVGLGNIGPKHLLNRHNLGFMAVDLWLKEKGFEATKKEFKSLTARLKHGNEDVVVLKPQTYMNRSGEAVQEAMAYYKVAVEDIIVLHDELDIPACSFRIKRGGGAGGHNGIKSMLAIDGGNFDRIRLGIGKPGHPGIEIADYVLGNLSQEEQGYWQQHMVDVLDAIDLCIEGKVQLAMNKFNRRADNAEKEKV
jgi:PTH1 family peptidyl-tRNA hydrolase